MEIQAKQPSAKGSPEIFTGEVWIDPIATGDKPSRIKVSFVHFAPGARNAWHAHALGQTIHVTEGIGRMQARGGEVIEIHPGDTVVTPPGEWHWHGAAPDHFMTHLAMWETPADGPETEWGAQVAEAEYRGRPRRPAESQVRGSDLSVLRELADEGNEEAARRLTELAAQRGDLDALRRLADEGNEDAEARLAELIREMK